MESEDYEILHDEYQDPDTGVFAHGILLMPVSQRDEIIAHLEELRKEFGYSNLTKRGFGGSLKDNKRSQFLRNQLAFGAHLLKVKVGDFVKFYKVTGRMLAEKKYKHFKTISNESPFNCKFGMLVIPDNHADMLEKDYSAKIELTLRFCIKGLCNWAFDERNKIKINKLYLDGFKHHKRGYDYGKILRGVSDKNYVAIAKPLHVNKTQRDKRQDDTGPLMDLNDAMVGGIYNKIYNNLQDRYGALCGVDDVVERLKRGDNNKQVNSRWYKAITVSELYLTKEERFDFRPLEFRVDPSQNTLL